MTIFADVHGSNELFAIADIANKHVRFDFAIVEDGDPQAVKLGGDLDVVDR